MKYCQHHETGKQVHQVELSAEDSQDALHLHGEGANDEVQSANDKDGAEQRQQKLQQMQQALWEEQLVDQE